MINLRKKDHNMWIRCLIFFSTLLSVFCYLISPAYYSSGYATCVLMLFFFSFIMYLFSKNTNDWFSFDFLFSITFFFVYIAYPVFIYPINKTRFFMFNNGFNEKVIIKSTFLALVGYNFFLLGYLSRYKILLPKKRKNLSNLLPTILLLLFVLVNFVYIVFLGGSSLYSGDGDANPTSSSGIWSYFKVVKSSLIIVIMTIEFYNNSSNAKVLYIFRKNPISWFLIFIDVLLTLSTGSRGGPLSIIIVFFAGISHCLKGFSIKFIIFMLFIGFTLMSLIVVFRSAGAFIFSFNILDMAMDLIINNYTLYTCYDYVQSNNNLLFPMIGSLLSIIPFLQGFIVRLFNISIFETSSARFFSFLVLGDNPSYGVGTNIVSSLYLSVGFIGVCFFLYALGRIIRFLRENKQNSLYILLLYFHMIGYSVYLVRADFFYPIGKIVYGVFFLILIITFSSYLNQKHLSEI